MVRISLSYLHKQSFLCDKIPHQHSLMGNIYELYYFYPTCIASGFIYELNYLYPAPSASGKHLRPNHLYTAYWSAVNICASNNLYPTPQVRDGATTPTSTAHRNPSRRKQRQVRPRRSHHWCIPYGSRSLPEMSA